MGPLKNDYNRVGRNGRCARHAHMDQFGYTARETCQSQRPTEIHIVADSEEIVVEYFG